MMPPPDTAMPPFSIEDVGFEAGGRALLASLSLTFAPGQVSGLIGHNGSGKSTLLKIMARQQEATAGTVRCLGKPLRAWTAREFARTVAYLPQHIPPAVGLLVRELVALGRYPWHGALGGFGARDQRKVDEALALTQLAPLAHRLVDTLSGGERQRAWLAMLIAQDTRCLLLDEPISALDLPHQIELLAMIRRLSRERGLSVVVVLHDINMAARFCDEIVALHSGRLVARGAPETIMTEEVLQRIYGVPMQVLTLPAGGPFLAFPRSVMTSEGA